MERRLRPAFGLSLALGVSLVAGAIGVSAPAAAQQLPAHCYGVPDGLLPGGVHAIRQDSKGYVWIATSEGVSRFDGYGFRNYGQRDGLGHPIANAIAEDASGTVWIATNGGGVSRALAPPPGTSLVKPTGASDRRPAFEATRIGDGARTNQVNALLFDAEGALWCATDEGLYRGRFAAGGRLPHFGVVVPHEPVSEAMAAFTDSRRRLWFGMADHLVEVVHGTLVSYGADDVVGRRYVRSITEDARGRLLVANEREVLEWQEPGEGVNRGRWLPLPVNIGPARSINAIAADADGNLWVGTSNGLLRSSGAGVREYTASEGLAANDISTLHLDGDANLWIGFYGGGVCRVSRAGVAGLTMTSGLAIQTVHQVVEDSAGRTVATTGQAGVVEVTNGRAATTPAIEPGAFTWSRDRLLHDGTDRWWIASERGLLTTRTGALAGHASAWQSVQGVPTVPVTAVHEDRRGGLWAMTMGGALFRSDRPSRGPRRFVPVDLGGAWPRDKIASRLLADRSGALWLAGQGVLARWRNGRLELQQPVDGLPETNARALFEDTRGWLWVGLRYRGVSVTTDPAADHPRFTNYSSADGLGNDTVWCMAEDEAGRIYLGTSNGVGQFDPATMHVRHLADAEGLAGYRVTDCVRDRRGGIWVATLNGLSRLDPRADATSHRRPVVYVNRLEVAGDELPLPETGSVRLPSLRLSAFQNNLLIGYVAPYHGAVNGVRYRYRLDGADLDWSAPTEQRTVHYGHLSPGAYRFQVEAVTPEDGVESEQPATFAFTIARPVWQRWWFLATAIGLLAVAVHAVYRLRLQRLVQLERLRTRLATDLHDDIGSDLSMIAMASEMARARVPADAPALSDALGLIARTSRELVDATSDIVWSVNPARDRLQELVNRMRRFAEDACGAANVVLHFRGPEGMPDAAVDPDVRRELFLIFKESINNVIRHSQCRDCTVNLTLDRPVIQVAVRDDGRGFDLARPDDGNGLASMRRRAARIGAHLRIETRPGAGTTVSVRASLVRPR